MIAPTNCFFFGALKKPLREFSLVGGVHYEEFNQYNKNKNDYKQKFQTYIGDSKIIENKSLQKRNLNLVLCEIDFNDLLSPFF